MKVCPHCNGITEEHHALKCSICGQDIKDEPEYSEEELNDELVLSEITFLNKKRKKVKQIKKIAIFSTIFVILVLSLVLIFGFEPKGHLEIKNSDYEVEIGEIFTIDIIYSEKVSSKNVRLEIVSSDYNGKEISFRYKIEDEKFVMEPMKEDHLQLRFYVKDDGTQKNYNNLVNITITSSTNEN